MENEPIRDPRLWEALEACRPGHEDLADPGMASLARELAASPEFAGIHQKLQRLDAAMADVFRDVPVPAGLEARILAQLEAVPVEAPSPSLAVVPASRAPERSPGPNAPGPHVLRRRWLLVAGGLTAAAAVILIIALSTPHKQDDVTKSDVLNVAVQFYLSDTHEGAHVLRRVAPPREYPFSQALVSVVSRRFSEIRWRWIAGFLNRGGVAFDVVGPQGIVATLYVTECSVDGLPAEVPLRAMLSTGETSVSAWQEGELLYVLVVDGGIQAYERFFAVSDGPLA